MPASAHALTCSHTQQPPSGTTAGFECGPDRTNDAKLDMCTSGIDQFDEKYSCSASVATH